MAKGTRGAGQYTAEQERWIARHAPAMTAKTLVRAFNAHFGTKATQGAVQKKAQRLGTRAAAAPWGRRPRYTDAERAWLARHAEGRPWAETTRAFNAEFGTERTLEQVRGLAYQVGARSKTGAGRTSDAVKRRRRAGQYTAEQERWIARHAPAMTAKALAQAFNACFGTNATEWGIRKKAQRLGADPAAAPLGREPRYSSAQRAWLAAHAQGRPWAETTAAFNAEFGTERTLEQVRWFALDIGARANTGSGRTLDADDWAWLEDVSQRLTRSEILIAWRERHAKGGQRALRDAMTALEAGVAPGRTDPRRWSEAEETWLAEHAGTATWDEIARRHARAFPDHPRSACALERRANRDAKAERLRSKRARKAREDAWLRTHAPALTSAEIEGRFNLHFGGRRTRESLRKRCRDLGVKWRPTLRSRPLSAPERAWLESRGDEESFEERAQAMRAEFAVARNTDQVRKASVAAGTRARAPGWAGGTYYTERAVQWLREHAEILSGEPLRQAFARAFGHAPSMDGLMAKGRRMGVKVRGGKRQRSLSATEVAWLARHAPGRTSEAVTAAFNAKFSARMSKIAMRAQLARRGIDWARPAGHRWTPEQVQWLKRNAPKMRRKAVAEAFNTHFGTALTPAKVAGKARHIGAPPKPRPTERLNEAERTWVAARANDGSYTALAERFEAEFGRTVDSAVLARTARAMGIRKRKAKSMTWREMLERLARDERTLGNEGAQHRGASGT